MCAKKRTLTSFLFPVSFFFPFRCFPKVFFFFFSNFSSEKVPPVPLLSPSLREGPPHAQAEHRAHVEDHQQRAGHRQAEKKGRRLVGWVIVVKSSKKKVFFF